MRKILLLNTILIYLFFGCDLGENASDSIPVLTANFKLTDTTGIETHTFHTGEDFEVTFYVKNTTNEKLTIPRSDSSPDVVFQIIQSDTILSTSIDGFAFLQVASIGSVEPGDSIGASWKGPNTVAKMQKIILIPGLYKIKPVYRDFKEAKINQVSAIDFTVIP